MMDFRRFLMIWLLVLAGPNLGLDTLQAQTFPTDSEWGPLTWGRAGSAAASAQGIDSFTTNPAGLARNFGQGLFGGHYADLPGDRSSWGVGLMDGRKAVIGGFRFQWYEQDPEERQNYDIAAVYRTSYGAFGATMNIYRFSDMADRNGWKVSQTAGVLIPIGMGVTIGAYGQNFLDNIDRDIQAPFVAMGIAYERPQFARASFQADRQFDLPDESWNYSVSAEFLLKQFFIVRSGYRFDQSDDMPFWTVGGGIEAPKLQFNGYYMRSIDDPVQSSWGIQTNFLF